MSETISFSFREAIKAIRDSQTDVMAMVTNWAQLFGNQPAEVSFNMSDGSVYTCPNIQRMIEILQEGGNLTKNLSLSTLELVGSAGTCKLNSSRLTFKASDITANPVDTTLSATNEFSAVAIVPTTAVKFFNVARNYSISVNSTLLVDPVYDGEHAYPQAVRTRILFVSASTLTANVGGVTQAFSGTAGTFIDLVLLLGYENGQFQTAIFRRA